MNSTDIRPCLLVGGGDDAGTVGVDSAVGHTPIRLLHTDGGDVTRYQWMMY